MLKPVAFGNAFAAVTAGLYIVLFLLKAAAPAFFKLVLNSQFFGADVASQVPRQTIGQFLGLLIAMAVFTWIFGYFLAVAYNYFSKKS
jgi:hypothetical protein